MIRHRLKITLLGEDFVKWGGGLDFLRLCANSLSIMKEQRNLDVCLLLPDPDIVSPKEKIKNMLRPYKHMAEDILSFRKPYYFSSAPFSQKQLIETFSYTENNIELVFYNRYKELGRILKEIQTDVVLPCINPPEYSDPVPWVGYLSDFQHKYYPDFFTEKEIQLRNVAFEKMVRKSKTMIVNSNSVKIDIFKHYPGSACRVFSLPFAAAPVNNWFDPPVTNIELKYRLPVHYFMISNQFWVHKSHWTAFEALAIFSSFASRRDVHIVCTGKTEDFRYRNYFRDLLSKIEQSQIKDRIHFLGHIPKKDQIDVMKGAIAVIQPTLFEGGPGGGAVYDAVAMGVPAILSDIPVNMEINGEDNLFFFRAGDAADLADKMEKLMNLSVVRFSPPQLMEHGRKRIDKFGQTLLDAIDSVIQKQYE